MGTAYMTPVHTKALAKATSDKVLSASGAKYRLFQNDTTDTAIYLGLGVTAKLNEGIKILAGGEFVMSEASHNLFQGDVYAIHGSTGDKVLLITEGK